MLPSDDIVSDICLALPAKLHLFELRVETSINKSLNNCYVIYTK